MSVHASPPLESHPSASDTDPSWPLELERASPTELLRWAWERWHDDLAIVTSFQAEGMVLIDLGARAQLPIRVITLDTGRLPEETHAQIDRVRSRYGITVEIVFPEPGELEELTREKGPNLFYLSTEDRLRCCHVRKVVPFRRAVSGLAAWASGIRRGHGGARSGAARLEIDREHRADGSLVKLNPLADWTTEQVWEHLRRHSVPYHPLYDRGYSSIGCAPCTRPARPAQDVRASRWWWEEAGARECGLHAGVGR